MKQNPFGLYDFLGYLIPGALFLYILHFLFGIDIIYNLLNLSKEKSEVLTFIPAVLLAYIIGHTFSLLSSFFIEKYAAFLYGYPSKYLFTENHVFWSAEDPCYENIGKLLLVFFLLPISAMLCLLSIFRITFFDQAKTLDENLSNVVFKKCMKILRYNLGIATDDISKYQKSHGISGDYFRIIYHFIFENSEKHSAKLQNYVALYGFCRTISFIFLMSFWFSIYIFMFENGKYELPIILSILCFLFFTGFVKFYRRYTLEALMGATIYNKK